jgi:hypothetical protein
MSGRRLEVDQEKARVALVVALVSDLVALELAVWDLVVLELVVLESVGSALVALVPVEMAQALAISRCCM